MTSPTLFSTRAFRGVPGALGVPGTQIAPRFQVCTMRSGVYRGL
jgi:hypothetical protein